ncbi:hypothetical protein O3P69_004996 [Scylla paramamosain]|uniref:Uncharacterized protein n=1 Tax=Scylla paramamosain TaxID=85552 RepID=A0AAW0UAB3_SCYPA
MKETVSVTKETVSVIKETAKENTCNVDWVCEWAKGEAVATCGSDAEMRPKGGQWLEGRRAAPHVATPHENRLKSYHALMVAVLGGIIRHSKHSTTLTLYFDALSARRACRAGLTRVAYCSLWTFEVNSLNGMVVASRKYKEEEERGRANHDAAILTLRSPR